MKDIEIIVVDNYSTDNTVDIVKQLHPRVQMVQNDLNLGFAGGVNLGAKLAKGETLALVNPDLVIQISDLIILSNFLDQNDEIGIVSPCVVGTKREMGIIAAGKFPKNRAVLFHWIGLSRFGACNSFFEGHYLMRSQVREKRQVDWVSGACLLISKDCWNLVGGLSERWFMYGEDIDLCFKASHVGYQVWIDPSVTARHFVGGSELQTEKRVSSDWVLNLFDFYVIAFKPSFLSQIIWKSIFFFGLISRSIWYLVNSISSTGPERKAWKRESFSFFIYSKEIIKTPLRFFREGK